MYEQRIETVRHLLGDANLTQMIVSDPRSIQYLTGAFVEPGERFLALVIVEGKTPVLFLNRLFTAPSALPCEVFSFDDVDNPIPEVAKLLRSDEPCGVDKNLAARFLVPLIDAQAASSFALGSPAVDKARAVKGADEQALMRVASVTNDAAMARFRELVHEGATELEIADKLEGIYRELGASGHSFAPIVSFGVNAADPHHMPDDTRLAAGDVVLFDVGCRQGEYCSDMTRTFFWDEPTAKQREVYELVRRANEAGRAAVHAGARFCDIDKAARDVIAEAGYGEYFTHRLGHQIGLDVHEPGDVSSVHDEEVQVGMCFSIEPGIYLPGEFGVRIEDLVCVTEDGCEVLNSYPRELTVLEKK